MRQRDRQPYETPQVRAVTLEGRHTAEPDKFRLVGVDDTSVVYLEFARGAELADLASLRLATTSSTWEPL